MERLLDPVDDKYYGFLFHYYRAEVYRETNWRNRLDITANWSIVSTAAMLTFVFSETSAPHYLVIVNFLMVLFFLYAESRRYRYYILLKQRTRILEKLLFAPMIRGENKTTGWQELLAKSLVTPRVSMTRLESMAWRMRRNYMFLFPFLFFAWVAKVAAVNGTIRTLPVIFDKARIGSVPGEYVFAAFLVSIIYLLFLSFYIPRTSIDDDLP